MCPEIFLQYCSPIQAIVRFLQPTLKPLTELTYPAAMDSFTTETIIIASPFPEEQVPVDSEDGGSSSTTKCVIA